MSRKSLSAYIALLSAWMVLLRAWIWLLSALIAVLRPNFVSSLCYFVNLYHILLFSVLHFVPFCCLVWPHVWEDWDSGFSFIHQTITNSTTDTIKLFEYVAEQFISLWVLLQKKRLNYQAQNPAFVKHQTHFSTSSITALCKIGPNCFSIDSPHKIIADMLDGKIGLKGYPTEQDLPVLG